MKSLIIDKSEAHSGGDVFHDPVFQQLERQEKGLRHQIEVLKEALAGADVVELVQTTFVDVGSIVVLQEGQGDHTYLVTGCALVPHDDMDVISAESPLGEKLLGARAGEDVYYRVGGKTYSVRVAEIRSPR